MKRVLDVALGAGLFVASLPLILVAAIAAAVVFRRSPFFIQWRVGRYGTPFRIVKIRTMVEQPDRGVLIPPVAGFLRRTHIDELPQLLLAVTGQMSLVGPRPETLERSGDIDPAFAALRTSVKPGCTGLWQISRAAAGRIPDAPEFDRFYVQNGCLGLDLWILLHTLRLMLGGRPIDRDALDAKRAGLGPKVRTGLATPPPTVRPRAEREARVRREAAAYSSNG